MELIALSLLASVALVVAGYVVVQGARSNREAVAELARVAEARAAEAALGARAIIDGYNTHEADRMRLAREQMQLDQQYKQIAEAAREVAAQKAQIEGRLDHLAPQDRRATEEARAGISMAHEAMQRPAQPAPPPPPRPRPREVA